MMPSDPAPTTAELTEPAAGPRWPLMQPVARIPVLTFALVGLNLVLWVAAGAVGPGGWLEQLLMPDPHALLLLGARYGPSIQSGEYWRLVTTLFLHAGLLHLLVDMWGLLQVGALAELLYGRARFLILALCSGVMGSAVGYLLSPELGVGSSGMVFGLMGAAIVFGTKYRDELPPGSGARMRCLLLPVLLLNMAVAFFSPFIDLSAPLGGLLAGGLLARLAEAPRAPAERREREALPVPAALLTAVALVCYGAWGLGRVLPRASAFYQASAAAREGDGPAAIRLMRQAMLRYPNDPGARRWHFQLLVREKRWPEATAEFLALSQGRLPPEQVLALGVPFSSQLHQQGRASEAEAVLHRLLKLFPDHPAVLNGVAYLHADLLGTQLPEAEKLALKALALLPDHLDVLRGAIVDTLAWAYFKQGKLEESYQMQQQAVQMEANNPEVRYHMGQIQEARNNLPAARHEYEIALRHDPEYAPARLALEKLKQRTPAPAAPASTSSPEVAAERLWSEVGLASAFLSPPRSIRRRGYEEPVLTSTPHG
jgi:membrane associated rhomboid family serine protease/Tfp pilus assembly protein PilF